jgi:hypothetical protein
MLCTPVPLIRGFFWILIEYYALWSECTELFTLPGQGYSAAGRVHKIACMQTEGQHSTVVRMGASIGRSQCQGQDQFPRTVA